MLLKSRSESEELTTMRFLNNRMELTSKEKSHYINLEKGYEGEVTFDLLAENIQEEVFIINDLGLEVNNSYLQIDTLIILQGGIHLIEIKNFEGDYYLDSNKLYAVATSREYKNPVDQLRRSTSLFRQLLQTLKQNYLVDASVIFINPEFTLYQAPMDQPLILPSLVNRFLRNLTKTPSKLHDGHKKLAQQLISLHQSKNPYTVLPEYNYNQLQKGMYCKSCKSLLVSIWNHDFVCDKCKGHEKFEAAILRNVEEYRTLFPERKITTQSIYDWCNVDINKKTICRILKKNFTAFGSTSGTFYK